MCAYLPSANQPSPALTQTQTMQALAAVAEDSCVGASGAGTAGTGAAVGEEEEGEDSKPRGRSRPRKRRTTAAAAASKVGTPAGQGREAASSCKFQAATCNRRTKSCSLQVVAGVSRAVLAAHLPQIASGQIMFALFTLQAESPGRSLARTAHPSTRSYLLCCRGSSPGRSLVRTAHAFKFTA